MLDQDRAIAMATERLQRIYPHPELLRASHSDALEEFDEGTTGWRVWFRVSDPDFGTYNRPVEVSDETEEPRLVKIYM